MNLADLFTAIKLTASINKLPLKPSMIGNWKLFEEKGINTTGVLIDERQGRLALVSNISRNGDPIPQVRPGRVRRTLMTTHLPDQRIIRPEELQNLSTFGEGEDPINAQAQVINDALQSLKDSLEVTREFQRMGALRGKLYDADGTTLISDLYAEFGVTKASSNVIFSVATTDIRGSIMAAKRAAEQKLGGVFVTGWRCLCSPAFFDAFTAHPKVQAAFSNYQEAKERIGGDMRSGFTFAGVEFIEYNATVSGQSFLPTGYAQMFPIGSGLYYTYNAPANYNEAVNTLGLPFYSKAVARPLDKGWLLEAQSNPLSICTYPEALTELIAA